MLSRPGILDVSTAKQQKIIATNQMLSTETRPDRNLGCPFATAAQQRMHCSSISLLTSTIWSLPLETRMGPPRPQQNPWTPGSLEP